MEKTRLARIAYKRLKRINLLENTRFTSTEALKGGDLFKLLIATILSQNTSDRNSIEAYEELKSKIEISPINITHEYIEDIEDAIAKAGLYRSKARAIVESAKFVLNKLSGDLTNLKRYSFKEAREKLTGIYGVGLKTADIVLLYLGFPAFPVDTHIKRISRRLGIVGVNADYEEISNMWRKALDRSEYLDAHLRLIAFGRKICTSKKPRCNICPLKDICSSFRDFI